MPSDPQLRPVPRPHPHDEAACKRRLAELHKPSFFQNLRIALAIKKLIQDPLMKERLHNLLSRKFLAALAGGVVLITLNHFGVSAEVTQQIVALVASYIIGQGAVDAVVAAKAKLSN